MKKIIGVVLHEWKFLVLVAVLLYGIVSINGNIQKLYALIKSELRDVEKELSNISSTIYIR